MPMGSSVNSHCLDLVRLVGQFHETAMSCVRCRCRSKFRAAAECNAHEFRGKVGMRRGCRRIELDARLAEDFHLALYRLRRVDEKVIAHFKSGLIERPAERLRPSRRENRNFRIVDENIARLVANWRRRS